MLALTEFYQPSDVPKTSPPTLIISGVLMAWHNFVKQKFKLISEFVLEPGYLSPPEDCLLHFLPLGVALGIWHQPEESLTCLVICHTRIYLQQREIFGGFIKLQWRGQIFSYPRVEK